jgi:hypothetical protein
MFLIFIFKLNVHALHAVHYTNSNKRTYNWDDMDMKLDTPSLIDQAHRMHPEEMEPLYWIIEDALVKGETGRAESAFGIMLYAAKYNKELISKGLRPTYQQRLKEISFELFGKGVPTERKAVVVKQAVAASPLPFQKEAELQLYLAEHPELISKALEDEIRIVGTEVETDCGYRCDIVAESDNTFYPIELKIGQANHQVVSQCAKYCFYFYRKLRYSFFKPVQGVVIANGADDWAINELRRQNMWVFIVRNSQDDSLVTLDRVD